MTNPTIPTLLAPEMPTLGIVTLEEVLEAPSVVLPQQESATETDEAQLTQSLSESDRVVPETLRRTEGQVIGDLALVAIFGSRAAAKRFKDFQHAKRREKAAAELAAMAGSPTL